MILLSATAMEKLKDSLLLNAYTVEPAGFLHGKAGISVALFELSRYYNDESLEDYAFDLFQESLAYDIAECEFINGTSGVAYVIHYLIKNKFIDADYMELYGDQHREILKTIESEYYTPENHYKYIDNWFFIHALSRYISGDNYKRMRHVLENNILKALNHFHEDARLTTGIHFHKYAARLLATCNSLHVTDIHDFLYAIEQTQKKLDELDYICDYPLFPLQWQICGQLQDSLSIRETSRYRLKECMQNILIPALDYQTKTNIVFHIHRLYALNNSFDYRYVADSIIESLVDENMREFEKKIYTRIFRCSPYNIGIGSGICRLILLGIYWKTILRGNIPDHITELLN